MPSDFSGCKDGMDERLTAARDSALAPGEEVVAQQMGDQGQAIVLTGSRILLVKAGLTATGTLNGQRVSSYELKELQTVKLRRGPMGAVLQLCGQGRFLSGPGDPPDAVIVFSDEKKVRRCEAMAAEIETALGRPVERIGTGHDTSEPPAPAVAEDPTAVEQAAEAVAVDEPVAQPHKKKERKTLAEEIFEQMTSQPETPQEATAAVEASTPPQPVEAPIEMLAQEHLPEAQSEPALEPEPEPEQPVSAEFGRNPYLPRPSKPSVGGTNKVLVVLGGLAALAIVGVAVTAPLRHPPQYRAPQVEQSTLHLSRSAVNKQILAIDQYRTDVSAILLTSKAETAAFKAAVGKSDSSAMLKAISRCTAEQTWQKLRDLQPPSGLAGAGQQLVDGAFALKSTMADASASAQTGGHIDYSHTASEIRKAEATIRSGLASIDATRANLSRRSRTN